MAVPAEKVEAKLPEDNATSSSATNDAAANLLVMKDATNSPSYKQQVVTSRDGGGANEGLQKGSIFLRNALEPKLMAFLCNQMEWMVPILE